MESRQALWELARPLGFWSSVIAGVATAASMISLAATGRDPWVGLVEYAASFSDVKLLTFVLWFVLGVAFVPLVASLHATAPPERRHLTLVALAFAMMYATIVSFNYTLQFTFVRQSVYRGDLTGLEAWIAANPTSAIFAVDILAYMFQGLATLFLASLFRGGRLAAAIRWLFVVNGLEGIGGLVAISLVSFGAPDTQWVGVAALLVWGTLLSIALFLLAYGFAHRLVGLVESASDLGSTDPGRAKGVPPPR